MDKKCQPHPEDPLAWDMFQQHLTVGKKQKIKKDYNTGTAVIPASSTSFSLLDAYVNKLFKGNLRQQVGD